MPRRLAGLCLALLGSTTQAAAETGYDLWLRYQPVKEEDQRLAYRRVVARYFQQFSKRPLPPRS